MKNIILIISLIFYINCAYSGIDVSVHQGGNVDFKKVKADGKNFVILRAGYGKSTKDTYFDRNYENAKAAGMNVGVYWYSYGYSVDDSTKEAYGCLDVIKGKKFEYPIYYDIEEGKTFNQGISVVSGMADNFCQILQNHGYFCGIYSSKAHLDSYFSQTVRNKYTIWVAQYYNRCTYTGAYKIWQSSSEGRVNGISGNVDLDTSYEDFPSIIKNGHFNGF